MNRKTLLGGAAALLLGAGFLAAPASASITLTHSGDVELTATMTDNCTVATSTDLTALGYDIVTVNAASSGVDATDTGGIDATDVVARDTGCGTANEDNPVWKTATTLEWAAEGTLANGLSVKVTDGGEMAFSGNFGTLTFAGDGAVKASRANAQGDTTVTGLDLGGHPNATSGTAGMVVNWQAPSLGGVDLWVSYAPNSADSGLDSSPFTDTFGIGGQISAGDMVFSAAFENASGGTACAASAARNVAGSTLQAQLNLLLGGVACGDETLTAIGMSMAAAGLDINAGWSELDTDGSDQTTMNIGLGTSVGDYKVSVDYVNAEKAYQITGKDEQTTLGLGVETSLGDGVGLALKFATNDYDLAGHKENNYHAEASVKVVF